MMISIDTLSTFLGWCSILNIGLLLFTFMAISVFRNFIISIHSKLTGVNPSELPTLYFHYIGTYKLAIIVLNIVPYFALKLMV
ncbi:DUF6868 family protein [Aliiglaciecola litoralis]|uniref:DUF6868 domain-containing protein n=1 Tax=Aliiglaciecola litoralis TaxID=582857 RepID=A0ABP3X4I9_9ALTE